LIKSDINQADSLPLEQADTGGNRTLDVGEGHAKFLLIFTELKRAFILVNVHTNNVTFFARLAVFFGLVSVNLLAT
jgi:hypothetical protein